MQMTVECVLKVGDTVKDKSDSIRFLVLCRFYCPQCSVAIYAYVELPQSGAQAAALSVRLSRMQHADYGQPQRR